MSQTPRTPLLVLPHDGGGGVHLDAGHDLGAAHPGPHLLDRTEQPDGGGELVPPVVEDQDPPAPLHLLELPLVAARRHVPPAPAAGHHLHVVAAHLADLARLDDLLEPAQRLVEQVVLHHPQLPVVGPGGLEHAAGAGQVVAHGLLQIDVPPVAEQFDDAVGVQRYREQRLHGVDLEPAGRQVGHRREGLGLRPIGLTLGAPLRAGIDERHHLDVGIVEIGADVEVIDAAEPDESGANRAVVGTERHRAPPGTARWPGQARAVP